MDISKLPENMQQYLTEAKKVFTEEEYQEKLTELDKIVSELPEFMLENLYFVPPQEAKEWEREEKEKVNSSSYSSIYEAMEDSALDDMDLWFELSELVNQKEELSGYDSLNSEERMIFLVDGFEREINNGGFLQFFSNSIGVYSHELLEALKKIKASEAYSLVHDAIAVFNPQKEHSQNIDIESSLTEKSRVALEVLEKTYHDNYQNLSSLLLSFLRKES